MPWFWGSKAKNDNDNDDDEEEYSDDEEYSTGDEDEDDEEEYDSEEEEEDGSYETDDEGDESVEEEAESMEDDEEQEASDGNDNAKPKDPPTTEEEGEEEDDDIDDDDDDDDDISKEYEMPMHPDRNNTDNDHKKAPVKRLDPSSTATAADDIQSTQSVETISVGDGDLSLIDSDHRSDDFLNTDDEDEYDDSVSSSSSSSSTSSEGDENGQEGGIIPSKNPVRVSTVVDDDDDDDDSDSEDDTEEKEDDDEDDDDEKEEVTSFWEKQSLLILAAEHDRVDILKAILTEEDDDRELLMSSGIPPLHVSISFGSTNATQSLLRMGADPSIRPNVTQIKQQQEEQAKKPPEEAGKVEIPNMQRFDKISAWELAFGNANYEKFAETASKSWSLFGKSSSTLGGDGGSSGNTENNKNNNKNDEGRIIKPVNMAPSKREGIRHAFTAESLRCIGGDEHDRLEQLLDSGMPPSIDIGGKDLYGWAVEMGAMKCEELLRPVEAAKHGNNDNENTGSENDPLELEPDNDNDERKDSHEASPPAASSNSIDSSFRVLDRPNAQQESVSDLINRLDELESLASALSTCLDNLAEEVSVCHGLLLMGGGASALAAHVKSLKNLQYQKARQLAQAQNEAEASREELAVLIQRAGGEKVVAKQMPANLGIRKPFSRTESFLQKEGNNSGGGGDEKSMEAQRCQLKAQIAASENKIRKLRTSIADLSDENTREMQEVEKRGLSGGINLVRGLREELRDCDFQLAETKSSQASYRAKIAWIHQQQPQQQSSNKFSGGSSAMDNKSNNKTTIEESSSLSNNDNNDNNNGSSSTTREELPTTAADDASGVPSAASQSIVIPEEKGEAPSSSSSASTTSRSLNFAATQDESKNKKMDLPLSSERIAKGDSQAIVIRPSTRGGYFTVDLWQVLLRIIGFDRAAARRGVEAAQKQPAGSNLMIV